MTNHTNYQMRVLETRFVADTVENLAAALREWVEENNYGASDIGGRWSVRHAGREIGAISYNGRYWPNNEIASPDETAKAASSLTENAGVLGRAASAKGIPNAPWLDREFVATQQGPPPVAMPAVAKNCEAWTAGWTDTELAVRKLSAGPELARNLFAFGVVRLAGLYEMASGRDDEIAFLAREAIEHLHRRVAAATAEQLMDDAQGLIRQAALNSVLDALDSGRRAGTICDLELLQGAEVLVRAASERAATAPAAAEEEGPSNPDPNSAPATDDELRALWRSVGGSFFGPNVETGDMPEAKLLPFLRSLGAGNPQHTTTSLNERVSDRVLRAALRMALNGTPYWQEAAKGALDGKPQERVAALVGSVETQTFDGGSEDERDIDREGYEP